MADFESLHNAESEAREDAGGLPPAELPPPEPEPEPEAEPEKKELTEEEAAAAAKKLAKKERKKREPAKEMSLSALKKVRNLQALNSCFPFFCFSSFFLFPSIFSLFSSSEE